MFNKLGTFLQQRNKQAVQSTQEYACHSKYEGNNLYSSVKKKNKQAVTNLLRDTKKIKKKHFAIIYFDNQRNGFVAKVVSNYFRHQGCVTFIGSMRFGNITLSKEVPTISTNPQLCPKSKLNKNIYVYIYIIVSVTFFKDFYLPEILNPGKLANCQVSN